MGILAALCLALGLLDLGFTGVTCWHWALELKYSGGSPNEFIGLMYWIWVIGGLITALSLIGCGIVLLQRGPRVKVALVCIAQLQLISALAAAGVSLAVCAQFENTGPYSADAIVRGLWAMVFPVLLTVVALRPKVSRYLAG